jgi:hypothetical protein
MLAPRNVSQARLSMQVLGFGQDSTATIFLNKAHQKLAVRRCGYSCRHSHRPVVTCFSPL